METACLTVANELGTAGYTNRCFVIDQRSGDMLEAFNSAFEQIEIFGFGRLRKFVQFMNACRKHHPQVVMCHLYNIEHVTLGLAARIAGVRNILCVQGNPVQQNSSMRMRAKLRLISRLTRLIGIKTVFVTDWIERSMHSLLNTKQKTRVIYNGCDVEKIQRIAAEVKNIRDDKVIRIGMVARLNQIKDHDTLIKAFASLPQFFGDREIRLELVGDGELRSDLETLARELNVDNRVVFHGMRGEIPEFLGTLDVFVLSTTRDEGFGIVMIEALASRVPIIASAVPACTEVLQNGKLGSLVAAGDYIALAEALSKFIREGLGVPIPSNSQVKYLYDKSLMAKRYLDFSLE